MNSQHSKSYTKMEAVVICIKGLEEVTQLEIKEILKTKSEIILPSRLKFRVKDNKSLPNFIFNTRSSIKVYRLIEKTEFKELKDLLEEIKKIKFPDIKYPFVVRCERTGEHNFSSIDIEKEIGEIILNKDKKARVDLYNPTTTIIIDIINNNCLVGIDYTGIKLTKRDYRIRLLPNSINPVLAYAMLRIADIKEKDKILDPFCKSGEILIEAALFLKNIPPNKRSIDNLLFNRLTKYTPKIKIKDKKLSLYAIDDSQNNLKSAQINSKIANVNNEIRLSRQDTEWLDTKFKKSSLDKIITFPPYPTNNIPKEKLEKTYKEFFYQSKFILKPKGTITMLTTVQEIIEKYAKEQNFKKEKELNIEYLKQTFYILKFKK